MHEIINIFCIPRPLSGSMLVYARHLISRNVFPRDAPLPCINSGFSIQFKYIFLRFPGLRAVRCWCTRATRCAIARTATIGRSDAMARRHAKTTWNSRCRVRSASMAAMCTRLYCPRFIGAATGCCRWVT